MKFKIGNTGDEVEIGQYRELNKGALKAFFSMVTYSSGQYTKQDKTLDCKYFVNGANRWFSFPQKEIKFDDGRKTEYIPYRSYGDKEYMEQLKTAVLEALKHEQDKGSQSSHSERVERQAGKVHFFQPSDEGCAPF